MLCLHCSAPTSNGLALCDLCQRKVTVDLEFLPIYFRNLARWRPGRAGSRPVPGSRVLYDGETSGGDGDRIWRALDEAGNDLTIWARTLADDRVLDLPDVGDTEVEQVTALCAWLTEHLTSIGTLDWAGEFVTSIGEHEALLRGLTEVAVPGWYAGACGRKVSMTETCGASTYVVPGLTWVTCSACGATTYVRDHLPVILAEARGWAAPPASLAALIVALVDEQQSVDDLRKRIAIWGARERIATVRNSDYAVKKHRLGEVLDRLAS